MNNFLQALKGASIGIAEVIPGVSGGTLAFITGIYQQLIESIKSFDLEFIRLLLQGELKKAWVKINGAFLLPLMVGMLGGLIVGILLISSLLESHPTVVWGFFFGLILASAWYIIRRIGGLDIKVVVTVILGTAIAYAITTMSPAQGSGSYLAVFASGCVAICALILPGISGSFILLLMGMYTIILGEARNFLHYQELNSLAILVVFMMGAGIGLIVFSRVISWLLLHYQKVIYGLLCGFMLGSLNKIWPWRDPILFVDLEGNLFDTSIALNENWRVMRETNKWPGEYLSGDPYTLYTVLACIAGMIIVLLMDYFELKNKR